LIAQDGGVLVRAGHTEACCDLARLAGLTPAAVLCEIMRDDGTMARLPDLLEFAAAHQLKIGTIADLIEYRSRNESLVKRGEAREIDTPWGRFQMVPYRDLAVGSLHLALVSGKVDSKVETLVRVHEPTSLLDLLDTGRGTHSWGVGDALKKIQAAGCGVMVLMNCNREDAAPPQAGRSLDLRLYGIGAQILRDLGVGRMRLMAAPRKMPSMQGFGLEVTGYVGK
jgi:3,4-dihydroxy 2-butanone 4-phosphate synthase/GTP cyclohydrolase II